MYIIYIYSISRLHLPPTGLRKESSFNEPFGALLWHHQGLGVSSDRVSVGQCEMGSFVWLFDMMPYKDLGYGLAPVIYFHLLSASQAGLGRHLEVHLEVPLGN
jgi:hypothetical protein